MGAGRAGGGTRALSPSAEVPGSSVADYEYSLPQGRIARYPADRRDGSRLMVVSRGGRTQRHRRFSDLPDLLAPGDLIVVNESRVLPARLLGRKPTGAQAEVLLVRPRGRDARTFTWEALVRPGAKLKPGRVVEISDDLSIEIAGSIPGGGRLVELVTELDPLEAIRRFGRVPLPPYLERDAEPADRDRYQTVYARVPGSVAAPTAGLHFTPALLDDLERRGVRRTAVTLHVGPGTFRPVEADDPDEHEMHVERLDIPMETARAVAETRAAGGRVWAVGTTVVRALEGSTTADGTVAAGPGATDLFIRPPYAFSVVDALITNFHLPRSTLLMLVAAFAGYQTVMSAYREAVAGPYRFYSYGDAMAVLPD